MREDDRDRVSRQGTAAWARLKKDKNWNDWIKVGEALLVGREWAMNQASTNRPEGKAYNMAFGEWMITYKLGDMDKGDRSRLFEVMDALPMIEEWRHTLPMTIRLKLNHPSTVLRKWKSAFETDKEEHDARPSKAKQTGTELAAALEQIKHLKAHVAEIEASRNAVVGDTSVAPFSEQLHAALCALHALVNTSNNWPPLSNPNQIKRRSQAIELIRSAGSELRKLAK
jgi:hypothetical protein